VRSSAESGEKGQHKSVQRFACLRAASDISTPKADRGPRDIGKSYPTLTPSVAPIRPPFQPYSTPADLVVHNPSPGTCSIPSRLTLPLTQTIANIIRHTSVSSLFLYQYLVFRRETILKSMILSSTTERASEATWRWRSILVDVERRCAVDDAISRLDGRVPLECGHPVSAFDAMSVCRMSSRQADSEDQTFK
jgi:hypothetical protein